MIISDFVILSTIGGGEGVAPWRLPLLIGRDYYLIRRHDPGEQTYSCP